MSYYQAQPSAYPDQSRAFHPPPPPPQQLPQPFYPNNLSHAHAQVQAQQIPHPVQQQQQQLQQQQQQHQQHQQQQRHHFNNQIQQQSQPPHQYGPYGGEATMSAMSMSMSMPPPSAVAASMSQHRQPSAPPYQQSQMQNNSQPSSGYLSSQSQFSAPPQSTPQSFYPQSTPPIQSPTHTQPPAATTTASTRPQVASAMTPSHSPQSQLPPRQQQQQQQQQHPPSQMQHRASGSMSHAKPILQPPLSPKSAKLETERVTALLDVNRILLQEIVQLQASGRAGPRPKESGQQTPVDQQGPGQASPTGSKVEGEGSVKDGEAGKEDVSNPGDQSATKEKEWVQSREYIECMRRLQSNLAYLAYIADRIYKPADQIPANPAIMEAPPPIAGNTISEEVMRELEAKYKHLRVLYPAYVKRREREEVVKEIAREERERGGIGLGGIAGPPPPTLGLAGGGVAGTAA